MCHFTSLRQTNPPETDLVARSAPAGRDAWMHPDRRGLRLTPSIKHLDA
jgi:hypothetical protein